MYIKLALRNLRRSARDYGIYFLTVAVTVALMESFLALACARDVLSLSGEHGDSHHGDCGGLGSGGAAVLLCHCLWRGLHAGAEKTGVCPVSADGDGAEDYPTDVFLGEWAVGLAAFGLGALLERDWRESWPKGYGGFFRRPISTR